MGDHIDLRADDHAEARQIAHYRRVAVADARDRARRAIVKLGDRGALFPGDLAGLGGDGIAVRVVGGPSDRVIHRVEHERRDGVFEDIGLAVHHILAQSQLVEQVGFDDATPAQNADRNFAPRRRQRDLSVGLVVEVALVCEPLEGGRDRRGGHRQRRREIARGRRVVPFLRLEHGGEVVLGDARDVVRHRCDCSMFRSGVRPRGREASGDRGRHRWMTADATTP